MGIEIVEKLSNPNGNGFICSYCKEPMKFYKSTCTNCKMTLDQKYTVCDDCSKVIPSNKSTCAHCFPGDVHYEKIPIEDLSLKYYYFLTYFICSSSVAYNIYLLYNISEAHLFFKFSEFHFFLLCLFSILTYLILLYSLHNKVSWSWKLLIYFYTFFPLINIIISGVNGASLISLLVWYVIIVWPTYNYFKKRKHIFYK